MRHIKYAPKLMPINEDLTASMMKVKNGETSGKAAVLMYQRTRPTANCRGVQQQPGTKKDEAPENTNEAVPVVLEPLRQRADTALTAPPTISADGSVENKYGRTVLHDAVRRGDVHTVQHLILTQPELVRQPDKRGNQPLHYAANASTKNASQIVYCLLKAGAFVNAANERQQTPLVIQVISNETDDDMVTRILLHHNAKPRVKVTESMMLSQFASSRGLHKVASALCQYL